MLHDCDLKRGIFCFLPFVFLIVSYEILFVYNYFICININEAILKFMISDLVYLIPYSRYHFASAGK